MDFAFSYWKDNGAEQEADYKYTAQDGSCKADSTKAVTKVSGYVDVGQSEDALQRAVSA